MGAAPLRKTDHQVIPFTQPVQAETSPAPYPDVIPRHDKFPKNRHSTRTLSIVFTDLVGSSAAKSELGIHKAQTLELEHKRLLLHALRTIQNIYQDNLAQAVRLEGDSYIFVLSNSGEAIHFALLAQRLHHEARADSLYELPHFRVGIHTGEVIVEDGLKGPNRPGGIGDIKGLQADTTARIMSIANAGQILCSYTAFDNAKQNLTGIEPEGISDKLIWKHHGFYLLKGRDAPIEICEVGEESIAPFKKPVRNEKAKPASILARIPKSLYVIILSLFLILSGVYAYLHYFRMNPSASAEQNAAEAVVDDVKYKIIPLHGVFETIKDYGNPARQEVREKAPRFADQLLNLSDEKMDFKHRLLKYQFATYALGMAASAEINENEKKLYTDKTIHSGNEGLRLIQEAKQKASVGGKSDHDLYEWIISGKREELIRYMLAIAYAIRVQTGDDVSVAEVRKHLDAIPSSYKERFPPDKQEELKWVMDNKFHLGK